LSKLIQSGDVSRAVQLATAAIVAVSVDAQTQTESRDDLIEKRTAVSFTRIRFEQHCIELNPDNNNNNNQLNLRDYKFFQYCKSIQLNKKK